MAEAVRLQRGDQGEWVEYLQKVIEGKGISPGRVDGVFGDVLDATVRKYQEDSGLTVDGVVDSQTWDSLVAGEQAESTTTGGGLGIDWESLPYLNALRLADQTENGMRDYLVSCGIDMALILDESVGS